MQRLSKTVFHLNRELWYASCKSVTARKSPDIHVTTCPLRTSDPRPRKHTMLMEQQRGVTDEEQYRLKGFNDLMVSRNVIVRQSLGGDLL